MGDAITRGVYAACVPNTAWPSPPVAKVEQWNPVSIVYGRHQLYSTHIKTPFCTPPSPSPVIHTPAEHSIQHVLFSEILHKAGQKALGGGLPGMAAMTVQVVSLMWLRTTVNYQYRYGMNTTVALRTLWREGGVPRFYQGLGPALLQVRTEYCFC